MTKIFLLVFCQAETAYPNSPEKILFPEPCPNFTWEEDGWHRSNHVKEPTSTSMVRAVMVQCSRLCPYQGSFASTDVRLLTMKYWFWAEGRTVGHCSHSELVHMFKGLLKNIFRFYDMHFCVPGKSSFEVQIWTISWFQNDADMMLKHAIAKKTKSLIFRTTEGFELFLLVLG